MGLPWRPSVLFEFGPGERHRVLAMEGLRGIAVLMVFGVHYVALFSGWLAPGHASAAVADGMREVGHAGVDLFFVLSGYLIYGAVIRRPVDLRRFLSRRVERIYPTFLAVFVLYLALSFVFPAQSKIPAGTGSAALYLVANLLLLPGLFPIEPMITVAWSLSYEFAYYLTLPLLVAALGMRRWQVGRRVAFFTGLSCAFLVAAAMLPWLPSRLAMFTAGIVVYDVLAARRGRRIVSGRGELALVAAATALVGAGVWCGSTGVGSPSVGGALRVACLQVAFGAICAVTFHRASPTGRALSWAPLRWLGNMSYSFYLLHGLALNMLALVATRVAAPTGDRPWLFWGFLPIALAVALAASAALFLLVERPLSLEGRGMIMPFLGRRERGVPGHQGVREQGAEAGTSAAGAYSAGAAHSGA